MDSGLGVALVTTALMAGYSTPISNRHRMSEGEFRHLFHSGAPGLAGRKKARKAAKVSKRKNRKK